MQQKSTAEKNNTRLDDLSVREIASLCYSYWREFSGNVGQSFCAAVVLQIILFGWGGFSLWEFKHGMDALSSCAVALLLFFCLLRLSFSRMNFLLPLLTWSVWALYPLRSMTGSGLLSPVNLDTLFASDFDEVVSFLGSLGFSLFISLASAIALCFLCMLIFPLQRIEEGPFLRRWKIYAWLMLLGAAVASPLRDVSVGLGRLLYFQFATPEVSWHVSGDLPNADHADVYVIVMEESLSEKVMGAYGAMLPTTPFLSSQPHKRIETFVSPHMTTAAAVPAFSALSGKDGETDLGGNILWLAKEARLETHWLSAQGRTSGLDSYLVLLGSFAEHEDWSANKDDLAMIPALRRVLSSPLAPDKRGRLIFMHAYGAHEETCDRVRDMGKVYNVGAEPVLDCYLASALKADKLAKGVVSELRKAGLSYKLVFTSDHAINFWRDAGGSLHFQRNAGFQGQYQVPFMELGSALTDRKTYPIVQLGSNFPLYFPTWIGVQTDRTPAGYDIFSHSLPDPLVTKTSGEQVFWKTLRPTPTIEQAVNSRRNR